MKPTAIWNSLAAGSPGTQLSTGAPPTHVRRPLAAQAPQKGGILNSTLWPEPPGIVIGVNTDALMCPSVLVYEPSVPKSQAPVVDLLETADLNIKNCVVAAMVPKEVLDYLNPRGRVAYFYSRSS